MSPVPPKPRRGQPGDRIVSVQGKQAKSWEDAQKIAAFARTNVLAVTFERDGVERTCYLHTKVNPQLDLKLLDLDPLDHPVIRNVKSGSAAEKAGLKKGDEVLSFAGVPVVGQDQLIELIQKRPNQSSQITVKRGQEQLRLDVTPGYDPATHGGLLGVLISPNTTTVYEVQHPGPKPWVLVGEVCQETFSTIAALVHSKQTRVGVKDLSGPPGILAMLAVELKTDIRLALKFMVLLNISLAILNLLPLPVPRWRTHRHVCARKHPRSPTQPTYPGYATTVFAVLLISFMIYVSYNDIVRRIPLFQTLFNQQVQIEQAKPDSPSKNPAQ